MPGTVGVGVGTWVRITERQTPKLGSSLDASPLSPLSPRPHRVALGHCKLSCPEGLIVAGPLFPLPSCPQGAPFFLPTHHPGLGSHHHPLPRRDPGHAWD